MDQDTPYAVPAILDGRLPHQERLPVAADHAQNIFSLLAGRYELHVREDGTALCAPTLCTPADREGFVSRMRSLSGDVARAYGHLVLPEHVDFDEAGDTTDAVAANRRTPRESKRHRYLRLHANLAAGRPQRFEDFVAAIEGGSRPRLHLIHILLPHVPFLYLPSGRRYRSSPKEAIPGLESRPGYSVPFLVKQTYARHLLQVQATDRLLGRLLDRLHAVGIYDRALVAVVADHGISFRRGHDRRLVRPANVEDIAPVPFFVKAPGQRSAPDQRQAAAHGRRAAHDRGQHRRAHPLADRRQVRARLHGSRPAAASNHRQEVPGDPSRGHPRLPARAASRAGTQAAAVRR